MAKSIAKRILKALIFAALGVTPEEVKNDPDAVAKKLLAFLNEVWADIRAGK